ncbi:muts domain V-domain-containing protein [Kockovaella imperatae]|uniref:Muts domain V-domain-containing protein n=1 Tax=Kockovaella imperatae TaxID=4999 RepID=A0A1Y1UE23_9TREE|nr:muts domain V-domain-containing protein [Kockovaella imperatae]ORX35764.1 muts domain V-domain-containing protein [Kockovaella imperatae]
MPSTMRSQAARTLSARSSAVSDGPHRQIGLASFSFTTGQIFLSLVKDSANYARTLQQLFRRGPQQVLYGCLPSNSIRYGVTEAYESSHSLASRIADQIVDRVDSVSVSTGDDQHGIRLVQDLAADNSRKPSVIISVQDKSATLYATSMLFSWLRQQAVPLRPNSLYIRFETLEGFLFIDHLTARDLELVHSGANCNNITHSLYGVLNRCLTAEGRRALRTGLLQPSNNIAAINSRQNSVEELSNAQEGNLLQGLRRQLSRISDIDIEALAYKFLCLGQNMAGTSRQLQDKMQMLRALWQVLLAVQGLCSVLVSTKTAGLRSCYEILRDTAVEDLCALSQDWVHISREDEDFGKRRTNSYMSRLYMVKDEKSPPLALARRALEEHKQDCLCLAERIGLEQGFQCNLEWRGIRTRLVAIVNCTESVSLPPNAINPSKVGKKLLFSTPELTAINARISKIENSILSLSEPLISDLGKSMLHYIPALYEWAGAIASLDLAGTFAELARTQRGWTRPRFANTIAIRNGRHPLLEQSLGPECVANDVYSVHGSSSFYIIEGPNMSGKSTFLKQIALLTVQAMMGSYIPADQGTVVLHDILLSRLSNEDSMENALSTFASEITTMTMMLGMATRNSLLLVDELGRGTSPQEGIGLSFAIAEALVRAKVREFCCGNAVSGI